MKPQKFLVLIALLTGMTYCEKDNDEMNISEFNQKIYFQYDYINFAWGYQHSGWLLDSSGNIYCYNKPENWYPADSLGFISLTEMNRNILNTDSVCYKMDKNELANKIKLIKNASTGETSEPIHEMYDAGVVVYSGFKYDQNSKTYRKVLLKQIGDFRIDNNSQESVELYEWLDSINILIHNIE